MKQILPVQIWNNGSVQIGNFINAIIIFDNLKDTAEFYWSIYSTDPNGNILTIGNFTMEEPDYSVWDSTNDINEAAYEWICSKLGLTLI